MDLAVVPPLRRSLRPEKALDPLRDRVHHVGLIVVSLVLSALQRSTDTQGRLLDARRTYEAIGGAVSGKTSFRNNVHQAVPLMRDVLAPPRGAARDDVG